VRFVTGVASRQQCVLLVDGCFVVLPVDEVIDTTPAVGSALALGNARKTAIVHFEE
jgi:hypothetical protein